jgi:hypothetical protein
MRSAAVALVLAVWVVPVRADRVHLVGGSVIEGKAIAQGDKVVVEVESGAITLSRDCVTRIESGESTVQKVAARHAQLKRGDVHGLLALADFCRDHALPARERELLLEVIEHAPDHPQARARLGYVRSAAGWITHDEHMRAQGFVRHEGQWRKREEVLELERLAAELQKAARERDQARIELERQKLALEQARAEAETSKARAAEAEAVAERERNEAVTRAMVVQPFSRYVAWGGEPRPHEHVCPAGFARAHGHGHCKRITPSRVEPRLPIVGAKQPAYRLRHAR